MMHSENGQSAARLPQPLCDALQIRVDALPSQISLRMKAFLNYCEGRISFQPVQRIYARFANDPALALGLVNGYLPSHCPTPADFQFQYAPEITFIRQAAALLQQDSQEVFDAGLEELVQTYLDTPDPRDEKLPLTNLLLNRAKSCPLFLSAFLNALVGEMHVHDNFPDDFPQIFQRVSQTAATAMEKIELSTPEAKDILAESYAHEVELVKGCLAAVDLDLDRDAFDRRIRELLKKYAAVRVQRIRYLVRANL